MVGREAVSEFGVQDGALQHILRRSAAGGRENRKGEVRHCQCDSAPHCIISAEVPSPEISHSSTWKGGASCILKRPLLWIPRMARIDMKAVVFVVVGELN